MDFVYYGCDQLQLLVLLSHILKKKYKDLRLSLYKTWWDEVFSRL